MKRKVLVAVCFIMMYGFVWAGGGSESRAPKEDVAFAGRDVTLKVGFQAGHVDPTGHLDDFYAQHPNIRVEIVPIAASDWPDYITTLQTMVVAKTVPDVYHIAIEGIQRLVSKGLAKPLNQYIDDHPEIVEDYSDLHPRLQKIFEINNNIYGLASDWNNIVLHMNLDTLKERGLELPDEDWGKEEFINYMKTLTYVEDGQKKFGTMLPSSYFGLSGWLFAFGASVLNEDMTASALSEPAAVEAFQFIYDLIYEYGIAPVPSLGDDQINEFIAGNVASVSLGRWPVGRFIESDINFDIIYLPKFKERKVIFGVGAWVVADATEYPEEAYALASWMAGTYAQENMIGANSIPARISVMEKVLPASPVSNAQLFRDSADVAVAVESPVEYPDIAQITMRYYTQIMSDEIGIVEGLRLASEEINAVLAK